MIIDSHCHLDYDSLYNDLDDVINRAKENNVDYLLTISTNLTSFEKIKTIINKYKNIYGTLGIHPHKADKFINLNSSLIIKHHNKNKKIIGIGETGLDYYYENSKKENQRKIFSEHLNAANLLNLPTIVHSRNAEDDTFELINDEIKRPNLKVLIHCFTGSLKFAKKLLDLGCFISLSGIITFKNSSDLVNTVKYIPMDRLLVETDSPYLSPVPFRGKINEPSFLKFTVKKLAEIKKISQDEVEKITTNNFFKLFNIN